VLVVRVDVMLLRVHGQHAHQGNCRQERGSPHRSPLCRNFRLSSRQPHTIPLSKGFQRAMFSLAGPSGPGDKMALPESVLS
jgi:hypothetical protein